MARAPRIFENRKLLKDFHEITLKTGLDHGFIYKPYAAWVDPIVQWFQMYAAGYVARKATEVNGH